MNKNISSNSENPVSMNHPRVMRLPVTEVPTMQRINDLSQSVTFLFGGFRHCLQMVEIWTETGMRIIDELDCARISICLWLWSNIS